MAKKRVVKDTIGMDPETGELLFEFEDVDDGKPEPTPEAKKKADENFAHGDIEKARERYAAVQSWATKINAERLKMAQELESIKAQLSASNRPAPASIPTADDPGEITQEIVEDPAQLKSYFVQLIQANMGPALSSVLEEKLAPVKELAAQQSQQKELHAAIKMFPDFGEWQQEMLEISQNLPENTEMTFSQLCNEARNRNPDKALEMDKKYHAIPTLEEAQVDDPPKDKQSDTEPAATDDAQPTADKAKDGTVVAPDFKAKADRLATETGVDGGTDPPLAEKGLQAAFDAAWEEVASQ